MLYSFVQHWAAKDAKEINVFFQGSEKRNFAIFLKFIRKNFTFMKKQQIYTNKTGAFTKKQKEHKNLREKNSPKSYFYFILTLPLDHVISNFQPKMLPPTML